MRQTVQPTKELHEEIAKINFRLGQKLEGNKKINTIKNITSAITNTLIKNSLWFNHAIIMKNHSFYESIKTKSARNISLYYLYIGINYVNVITQIQRLSEIEKQFLLEDLNKKYHNFLATYRHNKIMLNFKKAKEQKLLAYAALTAMNAIAGKNQDVEMFKKINQQNKDIEYVC